MSTRARLFGVSFVLLFVAVLLVLFGFSPLKPVGTIAVKASFDASQLDYGAWDEVSVVTIQYFAHREDLGEVWVDLEDTLNDAEGWLQDHAREDAEYWIPAEILFVKGPHITIYGKGYVQGWASIQFATSPWVDFETLRTRLDGGWRAMSSEFVVETNRGWVWRKLSEARAGALERAEHQALDLAEQMGVSLGDTVSVNAYEEGSSVFVEVTYEYYRRILLP